MRTINLEIKLPLLSSEVSTLLQDIVDKVNHDKNQEHIQECINNEVRPKINQQMFEAFERVAEQIRAIGLDSSFDTISDRYSIKIGARYNLNFYRVYGRITNTVACDKPVINSMWLSYDHNRVVDTLKNEPLEEQIIKTLKPFIYDELKRR